MPLYIDSIPSRLTKGNLLAWVLDTEEIKKQQVGVIEIHDRQAVLEVPETAGPRLAKRLDGQKLKGRSVQVWFESEGEATVGAEHFNRLLRLLELEARSEAEQALEWQQCSSTGEVGAVLNKLVIRDKDIGLGGLVMLTLGKRNPMEPLPLTRLSVGTPVLLAEQNSSKEDRRRGVITQLEKLKIEVALNKDFSDSMENSVFRIDETDDEVAMQRCRTGLSKAKNAVGGRLSELKAVLLGECDPQFDSIESSGFMDSGLNASQREAVCFALSARDVAVIHGPPGTGKTTTLIELIRQVVKKGCKVLACAPSNLGVDNLFERLLDRGVNAVRMGHPVRVLPHLRDRTLKSMAPRHRDMKQVKKLRAEANALFRKADGSSRSGLDRGSRRSLREEAKSLLSDARTSEKDIVLEILSEAEVICATNTGVDTGLLGSMQFEMVVVDEACQCTEPSCWIPILRADRVILAGDHCQLPPTVISRAAADEGFGVSLQERLVALDGKKFSRLLVEQYRMHQGIMEFSSSQFYHESLEAHPSVAGHLLRDLPGVRDEELTNQAVHYIDTSGASYDEEKEEEGSSIRNPEEAALAAKKVRDLIQCGVPPDGIAVITPYSAQVRMIRELVREEKVEVGSIDSFQGREKEAVIISLVRSNNEKEIGFLRDTRRMNVALTRARRKLIVIGNSATITTHAFYQEMLDYFDQIDAYHVVWEEE